MPCMAQRVGSTLTACCTTAGNNSSGYQQPPSSAITMPSMMLSPLAWPSVLTNAPIATPMAEAASAEAVRMTARAAGECPQFSFITKMPNITSNSICTSAQNTAASSVPSR